MQNESEIKEYRIGGESSGSEERERRSGHDRWVPGSETKATGHAAAPHLAGALGHVVDEEKEQRFLSNGRIAGQRRRTPENEREREMGKREEAKWGC